jgi:CysZ protein
VSSGFTQGFFYWYRGWGQLRRSRALAFYAVLPFLLAVCFFSAVFWITACHLSEWTNALLGELLPEASTWSAFLHYPLWLTLFAVSFLALLYASYTFCIVLCGPFYSLLAERTLKDCGKSRTAGFHMSLRTIGSGILKSLLFFAMGGALLVFSFVPLINFLEVLFVVLILAFDTMDYAFDAMGLSLKDRFAYFGRHFPQWLGMGASLALTLFIPGLTLLILPGAVVGAALIIDTEDRSMKEGSLGSRTSS